MNFIPSQCCTNPVTCMTFKLRKIENGRTESPRRACILCSYGKMCLNTGQILASVLVQLSSPWCNGISKPRKSFSVRQKLCSRKRRQRSRTFGAMRVKKLEEEKPVKNIRGGWCWSCAYDHVS